MGQLKSLSTFYFLFCAERGAGASRGGTITRVNWPHCMIARMHKKFKPAFVLAEQ
jgi:hypothetical protein